MNQNWNFLWDGLEGYGVGVGGRGVEGSDEQKTMVGGRYFLEQ